MASENLLDDEAAFEELFKDRFTENDPKYMEVKQKKCPVPPVIHPWKIPGRVFHKKWDYASRDQQDRGRSRHESEHDRSNAYRSYRDRSEDYDRNRSRDHGDRDRHRGNFSNRESNERSHDRHGHRHNERNHRD